MFAGPPMSESLDDAEPLTVSAAERYLATTSFDTGQPGFVGAEVEWLLARSDDPTARVPAAAVQAVLAGVDGGPTEGALRHGRISAEPGGAVKVTSPPSPGIDSCIARMSDDLDDVRRAVHRHGLTATGAALEPWHSARRVIDNPRYAAMETFFDRSGRAGRWMMCATSSVQVCVDAGLPQGGWLGYRRRWSLAHALGPVLVAAFANSPVRQGRPTGWKSTRQAIWQQLDPGRVAPVPAGDPGEQWARYALAAEVMCIRGSTGPWAVPRGLSFRDWITTASPRTPTWSDLRYHLTTLFPPVRPRGYLELRMVDGQAGEDWAVVVAVTAGLFGDDRAAEQAFVATERLRPAADAPAGSSWLRAARDGLDDPDLAAAALDCFVASYGALARLNVSRDVRDRVATFIDRYVSRRRCPADDVLDGVPV